MIFYFSATGNSKYVAQRLATATNEDAISITECLRTNTFSFTPKHDERIGFISPTYFWGLPCIVKDFLNNIEVVLPENNSCYVYHVATYGTTSGQSSAMLDKMLTQKGLPLKGHFSVQMPDTWTPIFDLSDKEKVAQINRRAEEDIEQAVQAVLHKREGDFVNAKVPMFAVRIYYTFYERQRQTKYFKVEDSCIGCGLCAQQCPVGAIEIRDGRPAWTKDRCTLCLGCLHRCPKFSIQYGKKTKTHGQYVNPNVKL